MLLTSSFFIQHFFTLFIIIFYHPSSSPSSLSLLSILFLRRSRLLLFSRRDKSRGDVFLPLRMHVKQSDDSSHDQICLKIPKFSDFPEMRLGKRKGKAGRSGGRWLVLTELELNTLSLLWTRVTFWIFLNMEESGSWSWRWLKNRQKKLQLVFWWEENEWTWINHPSLQL